jgi:hypothetical protein
MDVAEVMQSRGRERGCGFVGPLAVIGSRITTTGAGVFVHSVFRSCVFVPWDAVAGFELIRAPRLDSQFSRQSAAIAVNRRHQDTVYCLGASFTEPKAAAAGMLEALQTEQRRRASLPPDRLDQSVIGRLMCDANPPGDVRQV